MELDLFSWADLKSSKSSGNLLLQRVEIKFNRMRFFVNVPANLHNGQTNI